MRLLYIVAFSLLLCSCTSENFYTQDELDKLQLVEPGNSYGLVSSDGDVLTITIDKKYLEEPLEKRYLGPSTRYHRLEYHCSLQLNGSSTRNARLRANSMNEARTELSFNFRVDDYEAEGFIETSHLSSTDTINGQVYNDVFRHHDGTVFSAQHGFVRVGMFRNGSFIAFER